MMNKWNIKIIYIYIYDLVIMFNYERIVLQQHNIMFQRKVENNICKINELCMCKHSEIHLLWMLP